MSSAVSGLKAQQTAMDVIGNNIANVNTDGFRSSATHFEDLFYQTVKGGSQGTNPSEIGYGAQVADISKNMGGSGATTTDKSTDLYINGDGYFAVCTSPGATVSGTFTPTTTASYYTRVGNFHFDENGYLRDSNGNYVMGEMSDAAISTTATTLEPIQLQGATKIFATYSSTDSTGVVTYYSKPLDSTAYGQLRDLTFNADGSISATLDSHSVTITTTKGDTAYSADSDGFVQVTLASGKTAPDDVQIALANFVNEDGLTQVGNNYYQQSASSGAAGYGVPGVSSGTELESGALESSNVDIATEFTTMITAQRGFQANSRVITTSDTLLQELINLKQQ
jgi:fagellar hook-basal body proteins